MGLFDDYFDPQQFGEGGGLLGRLLSLQQQQGQFEPTPGSAWADVQPAQGSPTSAPQDAALSAVAQAPVSLPMPAPTTNGQALAAAPTTNDGPTSYVPVGNYLMPQFGRPDVPQPVQPTPDFGDRLGAGFQSWAHTPVGNPFAALANGITGFNTGQRSDQRPMAQVPRWQDETQQPFAGGQDATLAPSLPTANRPPVRVLISRIMARPNNWSSRYGR